MNERRFDFLPHPADLKIKAYGEDEKSLLANSILAILEYLSPVVAKRSSKEISFFVEVENDDKVELWIDFLNEVLTKIYILKTNVERIDFLEFSSKKIKAKIFGHRWESIRRDIKSITYHQAEFNSEKYPLEFTFICDV